MSAHIDISANAEWHFGEPDVMRLIGEGMRRKETIEIIRTGPLPKHKRVHPYEVNHNLGTRLWCGFTAVACVTGASTSEVRDRIRDFREDPDARVDGTTYDDMKYAYEALGHEMTLRYFCYSPTFKGYSTFSRWLKKMQREPHVAYLIGFRGTNTYAAGHWGVVLGDYYCCSHTSGKWIPLSKAPNRRTRVQYVYAITKQ